MTDDSWYFRSTYLCAYIIWMGYLYFIFICTCFFFYIRLSLSHSLSVSFFLTLIDKLRCNGKNGFNFWAIFFILFLSCKLGFWIWLTLFFFYVNTIIDLLIIFNFYFLFMAGDKYRWHQSLAGNQLLVGWRFPPASRPPCEYRRWSPVDQAT